MVLTGLDGFCGSEFWNITVTWNTQSPDFTTCFEQTVLVWVPCVFLWLFSPMEVYYLVHSKQKHIPWTWLNISKLVFYVIILVHCIADFVYAMIAVGRQSEIYSVDIYIPVIKFLTFSLAVTFTLCNRIRGIKASGLLFLFTFLLVICGVAQFRTYIQDLIEAQADVILYQYISYFVYYAAVIVSFLLNFFADAEPRFSEYPIYENLCTESCASFPSKLTFAWFDKLAILGWRRPLETKDLWHMNYEDTAAGVVPLFDKYWNASIQKAAVKTSSNTKATFMKRSGSIDFIGNGGVGPQRRIRPASIVPVLCKAFGPTFIFGAFLKLFQDLLAFVSPQLLKVLIAFVSGKDPMWQGYLYAVLLLVAPTCQTILLSQYFYKMSLVGLRIRTALISAIYRKALRMSNSARKESTVGEIVNLMSVDAQRFMDLTTYLNMLWSAPLQIVLALFFLWQTLGPSVLAGLAVMIILIPVNGWIATRMKTLQMRQMKNKDERVKLMNEILSGIKVLKLYAWEPSFQQQVLNIRDKELRVMKQAAYLGAVTSFIWACAPYLVSLVTFAVYVFSDKNNVLDAEKAFVSLSLFNILRFPLTMLPMLITSLVQANVSVKRLNKFMNCEELDPNCVTHEESERDPLVIENGTFSWGGTEENSIILRSVNLQIKHGQLVAVVGTVGSGKSSLLSAFLGEMDKLSGRVNTKGSIAYVPQQAWIQNATLRDNILFSKDFQPSSYHKIVKACALQQDFDMLPGGDLTEIGEKGINLSGGQKQRVSLARAVYSDSQVYFLDDPLSAVDSHVGKHIFENIIGPKGVLRKKTRILVTHAITYLPEVDHIVVLKDGEISESGTYKELLAKKGAFADFLVQYLQDTDEVDGDDQDLAELKEQLIGSNMELRQRLSRQQSSVSNSNSISSLQRQKSVDSTSDQQSITDKKPVGEKLIEMEKVETGSVKRKVYLQYFQSVGAVLSISTILLNVVFQVFSVGSSFWLSEWSSDKSIVVNGTTDIGKTNLYLGVYGALGAGQIIVRLVSSFTWSLGCILASSWLHHTMLERILHAPSSFFDTTPVGRIVNRFSKDVDTLDNVIPQIFSAFYNGLFSVKYLKEANVLQNQEVIQVCQKLVSKQVFATLFVICYSTPIFFVVIIPIGIIYVFVQRFYVGTSRQLKRLESTSRSPIYSHFGESITGVQSIRAYGVQARFIAESEEKVDFNQVCLFPSLVANRWLAVRLESVGNVMIFFSALFAVLGRDTLSPGLVGLSVSYALQVTGALNWLVRLSTEVETNIVAVERIKEYGEAPQEAPWKVSPEPPATWPDNGKVEFNNYQVRYREGLELVLKGITFSVGGGEKVGIVGRTGAGKSSLTLSLFRLLEAAGGAIYIDGLDISKLGLHDVRSRLTIIPQDPVLFSGTLRMNLDPFEKEKDEAIWKALELAHLKHFVKGFGSGLQHEVTEGGGNLSVGQRQLICLARALLRKTKVLVLDEATAAVDMETDELIQNTIRTEFKHCTVLTIAHRLNTIMDSDRVIVLDKGLLVEYDTPNNLLASKTSIFHRMAKDAGLV